MAIECRVQRSSRWRQSMQLHSLQNEMCMDFIHLHQEFKRIKNRPEYQEQANCWPRPWTIVPYETRLGQNNRLVRRPQMPLHILLTYVSSSLMTFRAVEQHKATTQRPIIN